MVITLVITARSGHSGLDVSHINWERWPLLLENQTHEGWGAYAGSEALTFDIW